MQQGTLLDLGGLSKGGTKRAGDGQQQGIFYESEGEDTEQEETGKEWEQEDEEMEEETSVEDTEGMGTGRRRRR